jgi:dipeptidyl aminopeptidase/acylaminoacyl peptidase
MMIAGRLSGQEHRFSVLDSVEMTHFSDPSDRAHDAIPKTAPNGRYFVVVTSRAVIDSDQIESTLWLFDNVAVREFVRSRGTVRPVPRVLTRVRGIPPGGINSYFPVIAEVRWAADSGTVYFIGYTSTAPRRLCDVSIGTGKVHILSRSDLDVVLYSASDGVVAYTATRQIDVGRNKSQRPSIAAFAVTGMSIPEILFPELAREDRRQVHQLWFSRKGLSRQVYSSSQLAQPDADHYWDVLALSPGAKTAVELAPVDQVPSSWHDYIPAPGFEDWRMAHLLHNDPSDYSRPSQYVSVDLDSGKVVPLIDAPFARVLAYQDPAGAVWGPNGKRLLLTGTFLPLDHANAAEVLQRLHPCAVASLDLAGHKTRCIVYSRDSLSPTKDNPTPLRLTKASFGTTDDEVIIRLVWHDERSQVEWYRFSDGKWGLDRSSMNRRPTEGSSANVVERTSSALSINIRQSVNAPPVLWATDMATGKSREIWNPNPQLSSISYGKVSVYHWKDSTGYDWTGGLVLPVDYLPGRRYPLVIQTHGFQDFEFVTDGAYTTGMAARPLASAGVIVLQVLANLTHLGQLREVIDNVAGFESAVDRLAQDGLIDPKRVGIVGFSRTCWYVERALIDDPDRFAAGSIVDGINQGYMQEMLFEPGWRTSEARKLYGAKPFGQGLRQWFELAPSFHLDRVHTPLMITAITPLSILEEWEIYSSLYQQHKPVDLIYIPKGQHILQRPSERVASQQVTVDWFRFWLQDYEDPDPSKHLQYIRWRGIRDMQQANGVKGAQGPTIRSVPHN